MKDRKHQKPEIKPCPFCGSKPKWMHIPLKVAAPEIPNAFWSLTCVNRECHICPGASGDTKAEAIAAWNHQTVDGKIAHLLREVTELRKSPGDIMEAADVLILLLGISALENHTIEDLVNACNAKMDINEKRQWGKPDAEGVHHHL